LHIETLDYEEEWPSEAFQQTAIPVRRPSHPEPQINVQLDAATGTAATLFHYYYYDHYQHR